MQFDIPSVDRPPRVGQVLARGSCPPQAVCNLLHPYAKSVGFTQRHITVDNNGARLRIMCSHYGNPRPRVKAVDPSLQRDKTSKRVGCPFSLTIWKTSSRTGSPSCRAALDGSVAWVVTQVRGLEHGPCPLLDGACHALHPHRHDLIPDQALPQDVRFRIKHYYENGRCTFRQMERLLAGDFPDLIIDERQVRNFMSELRVARSADGGPGQCRRLLERLLEKQHTEDPDLSITQLLDDDDRLKGVLWVTGEQKEVWAGSGADILIHDNTYNLDRLGYKLGVFSGISKEGVTVPVGTCFIIDEESESYEWQLKSFVAAHSDLAPLVIITDADPAVSAVVNAVFPDATHIWCLYHLIANIFRNCRAAVGGAIGRLIVDFIIVSKTQTEEAFRARYSTPHPTPHPI